MSERIKQIEPKYIGKDDPKREVIMLHEVRNEKKHPLEKIFELTEPSNAQSNIESKSLIDSQQTNSSSVEQPSSPVEQPSSPIDSNELHIQDRIITNHIYSNDITTISNTFSVDSAGNTDIQGELWVNGYSNFENGMSVSGGLLVHDTIHTSSIQSDVPITVNTPLIQIYQMMNSTSIVLDVSGNSNFSGSITANHIKDTGTTELKELVVKETIQAQELRIGLVWIHPLGIMKQNATYMNIPLQGTINEKNQLVHIVNKKTDESISILPLPITHIYIPSSTGSIYTCSANITPFELVCIKGDKLVSGTYDIYVLDNYISI